MKISYDTIQPGINFKHSKNYLVISSVWSLDFCNHYTVKDAGH